jgi:type II secretory pathway component PulC
MKDNVSPEEKLLRLIRGHKNSPVPALPEGSPNVSIASKAQEGSVVQKRAFRITKYLTFFNTNFLIIAGFAIALMYLLSAFIYPLFVTKKVMTLQEMPAAKSNELKETARDEEVRPYDFYSQGIKSKQIFGVASSQTLQGSGITVGANLINDINILGVVSGANPQAIVEDKKAQKTYHVNKGQMIGEFEVVDIGEGRVILDYGGQKFELSI